MNFKGGFFKGPNDIFEIGLNPYQISIYLYINRCSNNSDAAFPALRTIEKKCGMSRPTVIKTIDELISLGLLGKECRRGATKNQSNIYTISDPYDKVNVSNASLGSFTRGVHQGGKGGLPHLVKEIDHGGKGGLPYKELDYKELDYKEKTYIGLSTNDHCFLIIYNNLYRKKFNKDHPKITQKQLLDINMHISTLESLDVTEGEFREVAESHFDNLPDGNDGKIFAFLHASARHFEIPYSE